MHHSKPERAATLIQLRTELAAVLDTHGELAPLTFRAAMGRMVNEVLVLLAEHPETSLSTLFVLADELAAELAAQTDAIEGEALRLHLYHAIAQTLGRRSAATGRKTVTAGAGMRLLH